MTEEKNKILGPINSESIVQQVINKITEAIISGELKPGDRLPPEMELTETLRVSRNSLRAAMQALRTIGVLEVRRPEGTFVCNGFRTEMLNPMLYNIILFKDETHQDLLGLRQIIDIGISKLVISQGLTQEEENMLEASYQKLVDEIQKEDYDIESITVADLNFHKSIAEATHNSLAVMINEFLLNITQEGRYRTVKTIFDCNDREYLVKNHRMHLDALERKPGSDIDKALEFSYIYWKDIYKKR